MNDRILSWSVALAIAAAVSQANAALVEVDLPGGNVNEVTLDTDTGLEWLDLTATTNVAFDSALAFAAGAFGAGWRHATGAEVCGLFGSHALDPQCVGTPLAGANVDLAAPHTENDLLAGLLGNTFAADSRGFYDDGSAAPSVGLALLGRSAFMQSARVLPDSRDGSVANPGIGSFLVRAIPEPSSLLLVGLGVASLAGRRR